MPVMIAFFKDMPHFSSIQGTRRRVPQKPALGCFTVKIHPPHPLDHQLRFGCVKINDVAAKRFLTIDRNLPDLLATHPQPKKTLGVGHSSAQDAGGGFESGVVGKHGL
jgi:hypothetical protein